MPQMCPGYPAAEASPRSDVRTCKHRLFVSAANIVSRIFISAAAVTGGRLTAVLYAGPWAPMKNAARDGADTGKPIKVK